GSSVAAAGWVAVGALWLGVEMGAQPASRATMRRDRSRGGMAFLPRGNDPPELYAPPANSVRLPPPGDASGLAYHVRVSLAAVLRRVFDCPHPAGSWDRLLADRIVPLERFTFGPVPGRPSDARRLPPLPAARPGGMAGGIALPMSSIEARVIEVRGVRVMVDRNLAELHSISTKALNQAVTRNP